MAVQKQPDVQIVWHQVALVERFSSVLYPLDLRDLLRQMPTIGYIVPELVLRGTPEVGKPIANKGNIELLVNTENKTLGVRGQDIQGTITSFRELRAFYMERLDPSPGLATDYLEFDGQGWAKSNANPTEACSRFWANYAPLQDLGRVLEADVTNFGMQLVPRNKDPNNPDWFHIYIEPLVPSSSKRYRVQWIWRGKEVEELLKKFSRIDETLRKLILGIGGN